MKINSSGRDSKLTSCNSLCYATEDRCQQCDLFYYYYYYIYIESTSSWVFSFTSVSGHGIAPPYLTEMLVPKSTVPALSRLCLTTRGDILVLRTKTKTIGPRSFATSGLAIWNNLLDDLRDPSLSLPVFKQRLKSYLFKQC